MMKRSEVIIEKMKYIFGTVFLTAQRWQNQGDHYLAQDNVTTKQWLLLAVITTVFDSPPTLGQAAKAMGTSRQNIKQIALKLEKRGFLKIRTDKKDSRILRLEVTAASSRFWEERAERNTNYLLALFEFLSDEEIEALYDIMHKIDSHLTNNP